jgi:hypothetical protein
MLLQPYGHGNLVGRLKSASFVFAHLGKRGVSEQRGEGAHFLPEGEVSFSVAANFVLDAFGR